MFFERHKGMWGKYKPEKLALTERLEVEVEKGSLGGWTGPGMSPQKAARGEWFRGK